jgi:hypothetical protein
MAQEGLMKFLGSVSPAAGMISGKGLFGNPDVMRVISPLAGMIGGKHGGDGTGGDILGQALQINPIYRLINVLMGNGPGHGSG